MEVIYSLIPAMLLFGLAMVGVLIWAARTGQFDDLEGDGQRILMDEDEEDFSRISDEGTAGPPDRASDASRPSSDRGA